MYSIYHLFTTFENMYPTYHFWPQKMFEIIWISTEPIWETKMIWDRDNVWEYIPCMSAPQCPSTCCCRKTRWSAAPAYKFERVRVRYILRYVGIHSVSYSVSIANREISRFQEPYMNFFPLYIEVRNLYIEFHMMLPRCHSKRESARTYVIHWGARTYGTHLILRAALRKKNSIMYTNVRTCGQICKVSALKEIVLFQISTQTPWNIMGWQVQREISRFQEP